MDLVMLTAMWRAERAGRHYPQQHGPGEAKQSNVEVH
jgi:hypothetical protein